MTRSYSPRTMESPDTRATGTTAQPRVRPTSARAEPQITRRYDLRHSFVSLLLHEVVNPVVVARQAGHSLQTMWSSDAHVIGELEGAPRVPATDSTRAAREADVSEKCPRSAEATAG